MEDLFEEGLHQWALPFSADIPDKRERLVMEDEQLNLPYYPNSRGLPKGGSDLEIIQMDLTVDHETGLKWVETDFVHLASEAFPSLLDFSN